MTIWVPATVHELTIVARHWLRTISYPTRAREITEYAVETKLTDIWFIRDAGHISFRMYTYARKI